MATEISVAGGMVAAAGTSVIKPISARVAASVSGATDAPAPVVEAFADEEVKRPASCQATPPASVPTAARSTIFVASAPLAPAAPEPVGK